MIGRRKAKGIAPAHRAGLTALVTMATALGPGCRDGETDQKTPFEATPPPALYRAPAADAAKPKAPPRALTARLYGQDVWPCTGHAVCLERSPEDGTLAVAEGGAEHIDPTLLSEGAGSRIAENLFEGLLTYAPGNGPAEPGVATRWELAEDGVTYTFHLRRDARWSNGRLVTAHDFVYTWLRKLSPELGSQSAEHHFFIRNAEAYNKGKLRESGEVGVEALDDWTLRVVLAQPTPFWLHYVKTGHYAPVPREVVEAHGKQWTRAEHIVTNGPYTVTSWRPRDRMVLERNPHYWGRASVRIPRVVIYTSDSQEDDLRRYQTGQTHWIISGLPADKIQLYIGEKRPDLFIDPYLTYYFYAFRTDRPPFDDVRVRRAVNMAIDKERLVTHVTRGRQVPADGPVPPFFAETMGYPRPTGDPFDATRARRLLAEAGYPGGVGLAPIRLVYNTYESHRMVAEFVQRSLKDNLGIEIAIENMEWKALLQKLRQGDFQISRYGWSGLPDPYDFLVIFKSDSTNNIMGYSNPDVDRAIAASMALRDSAARMAKLAEVEAMIQRDVPIAPLYHYTRAYLKKPVLRGFEPELTDVHLFRYMYWGDKEEKSP